MDKNSNAYKTIGEVVKILKLKTKKGETLPTHTIRFWEKSFKQIKPRIFSGNRRYYDQKNIDLLKKIKFLLKDQGMTIKGVKKMLDDNQILQLDEKSNQTIKSFGLRNKVVKISNMLKDLKSKI